MIGPSNRRVHWSWENLAVPGSFLQNSARQQYTSSNPVLLGAGNRRCWVLEKWIQKIGDRWAVFFGPRTFRSLTICMKCVWLFDWRSFFLRKRYCFWPHDFWVYFEMFQGMTWLFRHTFVRESRAKLNEMQMFWKHPLFCLPHALVKCWSVL